MYLIQQHFQGVIDRHDAFGDFATWRQIFSRISGQMADFYKRDGRFTYAARFTHAEIERAFREGPINKGLVSGTSTLQDVFGPWDGWWSGTWSDGSPQRHIWDASYSTSGRTLQLVSQTRQTFAHVQSWSQFRSRDHAGGTEWVDLALNAYDSTRGVTGWVTKETVDLPHIGYRLSGNTLLWITWMGGSYFLFDEHATANSYRIDGRPFRYDHTGFFPSNIAHHGTYARHAITGWQPPATRTPGQAPPPGTPGQHREQPR